MNLKHIVKPHSQAMLAMCGTALFGPHQPKVAVPILTALRMTDEERTALCPECVHELDRSAGAQPR